MGQNLISTRGSPAAFGLSRRWCGRFAGRISLSLPCTGQRSARSTHPGAWLSGECVSRSSWIRRNPWPFFFHSFMTDSKVSFDFDLGGFRGSFASGRKRVLRRPPRGTRLPRCSRGRRCTGRGREGRRPGTKTKGSERVANTRPCLACIHITL